MAMDTYSPSHPTDDNDTENNDNVITSLNKPKPNNIELHDKLFNTAESTANGFLKRNTSETADESPPNAWDQELVHSAYKSPKKASKSPSRTVSKQSTSYCRENSSRSGHRRSRSRSANRRDRSKSSNRRGCSRSGNKRFSRRRSYSRSRSRNKRSRSRHRGTRTDSQAINSNRSRNSRLNTSRDSRRLPRSKSPPPPPPIKINKESRPLAEVRRSPDAANMVSVSDSPKQKWSYDSEEEGSAAFQPKINTFSDNREKFQQNFDNRQINQRNSEMEKEGSAAPPSPSVANVTQKINNFSDNRGRFQQNFDNRGKFQRNFDNSRNSEDNYDNRNSREITKRDNYKESINKPMNKFENCDSEEEFGAWGKKDQMDTVASVAGVGDWSRKEEGDSDRGVRYGQQAQSKKGNSEGGFASWKNAQRAELSKPAVAVSDTFAEGSDEEEFGAWGKETGTAKERPADSRAAVTSSNNKGDENDEDDDFGAWGSELKSSGMGKAAGSSSKETEVAQEQQTEHRQSFNNNNNNFTNNNNFNTNFNNNNQFGQRNYINNRFPMQNSQNNRFHIQNNQDNRFPIQNNQDNRFPLQNVQDNRFFNPQPNMFPVNYHPGAVHRPQLLYNQWNATGAMPQLPTMPYPPRPLDQLPFPLDMSVCPPLTNMMPQQQQLHMPPLQQIMPFVPPPPPSSMSIDVPIAPGNTIINHATNINQLPMNINHQSASVNRNQSGGLVIGQPNNLINIINPTNRNQQPMNSTMMIDSSNLLETLMTKAGLPSDTLRLAQEKKTELSSRSVGETFNNILKTAASSVISRLVENSQKASDNMSMSPPSPPAHSPPLQSRHVSAQQQLGGFVPPPLPNYNDILRPPPLSMNNSFSNKQLLINNLAASMKTTTNETVNVDEEKINRSDFSTKNDWQERVALEVKMFLKPAYTSKSINKNDYKEIMKRCVTKITRSGVTEINRDKIEKFVLSYVDKYNRNRKTKQHSAVSSSERDM